MFDGEAFGREIVTACKAHIDHSIQPLLARMTVIEDRLNGLPVPRDGNDADPETVATIIAGNMRKDLDELRASIEAIPPAPELPDIPAMIAEAIAPLPKSAADLGVPELIASAIAAIPPQEPKGVDEMLLAGIVEEKVAQAVAVIPVPKDGEPGKDGVPGRDGENGAPGKDGSDGQSGTNGKDGLDAVEFLRGADGNLIVTMSNGTTRDLGQFVGKDGVPGAAGRDGFGFDDLDVTYDGERTFTLKFARAADVKEFVFSLPVLLDRGVFKEGETYQAGDGATWAGSYWIAQTETKAKPGDGGHWRLAVKRGRDGKDGEMKPPRDPKPVKVG